MNLKPAGRSTTARAARERLHAFVYMLLVAAVASSALAGAGLLGSGDEQLASGEYFDRFIFSGNAGDELLIELSSSDFDPYLIVLDADDNPIAYQDDGAGSNFNVRLPITLPVTGQFTVVVTSALPGETGSYQLSISGVGAHTTAKPMADTPPSSQPLRPGTISGTVVDTAGQPLAGARVLIVPSVTTGQVEVHTDSNGRYVVESLPDVPYHIRAWVYLDDAQQQACLRMAMDSPADYDSFSAGTGAVKNFRWQLTGAIPDQRESRGTFGGTLSLFNTWLFEDAGNRIEFTFTPAGPLIDGSAGDTFTRIVEIDIDSYVRDIPVGPYQLEATLIEADGTRLPMHLSHSEYGDQPAPNLAISWAASGNCNLGNGWDWTNVHVWLP